MDIFDENLAHESDNIWVAVASLFFTIQLCTEDVDRPILFIWWVGRVAFAMAMVTCFILTAYPHNHTQEHNLVPNDDITTHHHIEEMNIFTSHLSKI